MPRGKRHSDETKAAVMAALLAGQGVSEVAAAYHLPHATVSRWAATIRPQLDEVGRKKGVDFDHLIGTYLEEILVTLTIQVQHFRQLPWLEKQPASELAVLHGVLADKGFRLLEAADRARADAAAGTAAPDRPA